MCGQKCYDLYMKTNDYESLDFFIACMAEIMDPVMVNGNILDTIKTTELSILSLGLDLVKIRNYRLHEGLGHKNFSAYVQYLVTESQKTRSSIYKWLKIGEVYLKYEDKLLEIGFSPKDGLTKLPYLERALKNNSHKEVYDNLMKMKQRAFANYARSITEENETEVKIEEETEEEWGIKFTYRGIEAVRVNKAIGKSAFAMIVSGIRLAIRVLEKRTYVWVVNLNNKKEWRLFKPVVIKAREELRRRLSMENNK